MLYRVTWFDLFGRPKKEDFETQIDAARRCNRLNLQSYRTRARMEYIGPRRLGGTKTRFGG